jgi:neutral trehalase
MGEDGLLNPPKPYAVPGRQFNEMYGGDRFFVQRGLRREARQTWHGT